MTTLQLFIILVPIVATLLAVILGVFFNNARINDLIGRMDARFSDFNVRFDEFRVDAGRRFEEIDKRFDVVDRQFDEFRADVNTRFEELRSDTNRQFDLVNKRIDDLRTDSNRQFDLVHKRIDELRDEVRELKEALKVTG